MKNVFVFWQRYFFYFSQDNIKNQTFILSPLLGVTAFISKQEQWKNPLSPSPFLGKDGRIEQEDSAIDAVSDTLSPFPRGKVAKCRIFCPRQLIVIIFNYNFSHLGDT